MRDNIGKYRGQRKDNGELVSGNIIYANGLAYIFDKEHGSYVDDEDFAAYNLCEVIPDTVGEFTGLKDKNGVEIYEGDIVEYNGLNIIEWDSYFARFHRVSQTVTSHGTKQIFPLCEIEMCEVIGNIHTKAGGTESNKE